MTPVADAAARRRALDTATSFIVQAPAGSGKTELLIQRYLALLATVERPEEVSAITFTRKAASEMRARVIAALSAARGDRPEGAHHAVTWELARAVLARDAERAWDLQSDPGRLRVQTIDALCMSLTRQMPVLSRFGAQPDIVDDASVHFAEAARETLAALEHDAAWAEDVQRLLEHVDNDVMAAERLIAGLLARRDHWLRTLGEQPSRAVLEGTLARVRLQAVARLASLVPRLPGFTPPALEDVAAWQALAGAWLTDKDTWRKKPPAPAECVAAPGLLEALVAIRELPDAAYDDAQWEALGAIARLLPHAAAQLKLVFERRGQADFVEIAQGASRALGTLDEPTDLLLALDYRIRHLLVDEFQDTSLTQKDLLEKLVSGWEPGDGRTLFLVGDPMQSIYRFREAEVGIFLDVRRNGIGPVALEALALSANFRSQRGVVDWVNEAFPRVMPRKDDAHVGAVTYAACAAVREPIPDAVTVHAFYDDDAAGEAACVARLAREAMALREGGREPTVAILVRSRSHLEHIVPRLRAEGLRFQAVEIEPLAHRPVVQDLLALARALSHLHDRVAWIALLRAPWAGLTLRDLEVVASNDDRSVLFDRLADPQVVAALSEDGQRRLAHVAAAMQRAWRHRARTSLRDAVEGAWLALGGPACLESDNDFEDAEAFLDHLERAEEAGRIASMAAFVAGLDKLYAAPDLAATAALQVMTIHKAKGLEFDTVIVPRLASRSRGDDRPLFMWMDTADGVLLAPVNPTGSDKDPTYEFIRALDNTRSDHEDGRLAYVAATRARSHLHLLGDCGRDARGLKEPARGTLLAKLWPAVCDAFAFPDEATRAEAAAVAPSRATELVRVVAPVRAEAPPAVAWRSLRDEASASDPIEFSWAGRAAREVGSVVHRWMQRIAEDSLQGWDAARIAAARGAIGHQLAARGIAEPEVPAAATRVVEALVTAIESERGRWLLGAHPVASTEHRVTVREGHGVRHLVIDRTFRDMAGRRWIVDYKTSRHEGSGLEAFLDKELERYDAQLEGYARAFPGEKVAAGLYFPVIGAWRERGGKPAPKRRSAAADAQLSLDL